MRLYEESLCPYPGRSVQHSNNFVMIILTSKGLIDQTLASWIVVAQGERTKATKLSRRYRVSVSNGNDDWTEVSRRHSSQMPIVMVGTRRRP